MTPFYPPLHVLIFAPLDAGAAIADSLAAVLGREFSVRFDTAQSLEELQAALAADENSDAAPVAIVVLSNAAQPEDVTHALELVRASPRRTAFLLVGREERDDQSSAHWMRHGADGFVSASRLDQLGEEVKHALAKRETQELRERIPILMQAQRASETMRSLLENINAVVWDADAHWRFRYLSPQIEKWTGYSAQRLIEEADLWPRLVHPDDRERAREETKKHFAAGEDFQLDYRVTAADGRVLCLRSIIAVETHGEGETRCVVWLSGITLDVTPPEKHKSS